MAPQCIDLVSCSRLREQVLQATAEGESGKEIKQLRADNTHSPRNFQQGKQAQVKDAGRNLSYLQTKIFFPRVQC